MPFMTGAHAAPVLVRLVRNLLVVQAAFFFFGLALYAVLAMLGSTTTTTTATISPGGDVIVMVIGMVSVAVIAREFGRVNPKARWAALGFEVVWLAWLIAHAAPDVAANLPGEVLFLALGLGVTGLLFVPEVVNAFAPEAGAAVADAPSAGPPPSPAPAAPGVRAAAEQPAGPDPSLPDDTPTAGDARESKG